jgi:hypothetical protein
MQSMRILSGKRSYGGSDHLDHGDGDDTTPYALPTFGTIVPSRICHGARGTEKG